MTFNTGQLVSASISAFDLSLVDTRSVGPVSA
jgi:hypothetical protein